MTKSQKVWEQELYNGFNYVANMKPFFHFFEADDGFAGLNFASEQEATKFKGMYLSFPSLVFRISAALSSISSIFCSCSVG